MSAFSITRWFFPLLLVAHASFATAVSGADPSVVRASHEVKTQHEPREVGASQENDFSYSPQWPEPPNTGALLLRFFVGTVVVLGLCVGSLWLAKPWLQRLKVSGAGTPSFHVEGSVAVGNRAMLYLVRVGETQLIAGTDGSGLKSLIALPPSFKEVLDAQVPDVDTETLAAPRQFEARSVSRSDIKE
jgi:flagellar biogenesis protein FliO